MKPVAFLRIASVLTLIHSILHTIGGVFGKPDPGASATAGQFRAKGQVSFRWRDPDCHYASVDYLNCFQAVRNLCDFHTDRNRQPGHRLACPTGGVSA